MPYVDASGAKLYFEESGHGYPIIFIHEFASDLRGWEAQVRYFFGSHRCIAYNARGYPPSDVSEDLLMTRVKVIALCATGARRIRDTFRGLEDTRRT
jgi:pimeloyl-ACP methyl ester carboxylesterase